MPWTTTRDDRRRLASENATFGLTFEKLSEEQLRAGIEQSGASTITAVYRNREYLVQQHTAEAPAIARLSVMRSKLNPAGDWEDGITWDVLQRIKDDLGFHKHTAIEVYPPMFDIVNIANIRHLWILSEPLAFQWARTARG